MYVLFIIRVYSIKEDVPFWQLYAWQLADPFHLPFTNVKVYL